jgi:hypothetical protein
MGSSINPDFSMKKDGRIIQCFRIRNCNNKHQMSRIIGSRRSLNGFKFERQNKDLQSKHSDLESKTHQKQPSR